MSYQRDASVAAKGNTGVADDLDDIAVTLLRICSILNCSEIDNIVALVGQLEIMGNQNYITPSVGPLAQKLKDGVAQRPIQCAGGFIKNQYWSLNLQGTQQGEALLLSSAQIAPALLELKI
jgi:hypothetical protein